MYSDGHRTVQKVGAPTAGGATAVFRVVTSVPPASESVEIGRLAFQPNTIPEVGVKGFTNECVLAIVRERLTEFQSGPFPCQENKAALAAVEDALRWLEKRTASRVERGVEGTHAK